MVDAADAACLRGEAGELVLRVRLSDGTLCEFRELLDEHEMQRPDVLAIKAQQLQQLAARVQARLDADPG